MYALLHDAAVFLLPLGVAYLMIIGGLGKNALEWKRRPRTCPSCGRDTGRCSCRG
jgi:hypothetical protein